MKNLSKIKISLLLFGIFILSISIYRLVFEQPYGISKRLDQIAIFGILTGLITIALSFYNYGKKTVYSILFGYIGLPFGNLLTVLFLGHSEYASPLFFLLPGSILGFTIFFLLFYKIYSLFNSN